MRQCVSSKYVQGFLPPAPLQYRVKFAVHVISFIVTIGVDNSEADTVNSIRHLIRRSREVLSLWQILDDNEFHLVVDRLSQVSVKDIRK